MDQDTNSLYPQYVRAVEFFNSQVEQRNFSATDRQLFGMSVKSLDEFRGWWPLVCTNTELQQRWQERFADPAAHFSRSCEELKRIFARLPITRAA